MDLWPRRYNVFMSARRVQHNDVKAWVKRYTPPFCALMPDKLSDPAANAVNQADFSNLCRMLLEDQMVSFGTSMRACHVTQSVHHCAWIVGDGTLRHGKSARWWNNDISDFSLPVSPRRRSIFVFAFPRVCYVSAVGSS
jgi:hypothetical protein